MADRRIEGTPRPARILIVDDHELVRAGLRELLESEEGLEICGEAEGAAEAMELVRRQRPDLMVIDIMLKGGSGVELIKQVRAHDPSILMLVASMHAESLYAERVLSAGAVGYVCKQEPAETIIDAIRRILEGRIHVSERVSERILRRFIKGAAEPDGSSVEVLSDRELEVFQLIGQGLTAREIGDRLNLSVKTIETYREHIKAKLGLRSANALIRHAMAWRTRPGGRHP